MSNKQAVLLIHGIGEQKPMETLRGFVRTVWNDDTSIHHKHAPDTVWSKPDFVSDNYELRRLTTATNRGGLRTDFFEFYWAHHMRGTTIAHVFSWVRTLLVRRPGSVPRHLLGLYLVLVAATLTSISFLAYASYNGITDSPNGGLSAVLAASIGAVVLPIVGFVVTSIVGDAARYLHPAPTNVQRRAKIRHAGVALLNSLHQRDYERVIVVGHSLGSVIGYDILTHSWAAMHADFELTGDTSDPDRNDLEAMARGEFDGGKDIPNCQRAYWGSLRSAGHKWLVTDFVTLGSPLAHAEILMARDAADLKERQTNRELPTCLPQLETGKDGKGHFTFNRVVAGADGKSHKIDVPHHAAVFAPTRWTNLYFPCSFLLHGDLVGGPLSKVFGDGVKDVPVKTRQRGGWLAHTLYWSNVVGDDSEMDHISALREALDLADDCRVQANLPETELGDD